MLKKTLYLAVSTVWLLSLLSGCLPPQTRDIQIIPVSGKVLNLSGIDPQTLDPAISGDGNSHQYVTQIFSGLLALDDTLEPAGDIATDWRAGNEGKTYTFRLRRDVRFQDGRGVKAGDFKYSWERAADPATGSLTAITYLGDIVGVKDVLEGKTKEISGVKVIDDYTLEVTIDAPKSYFLSKLTYPTTFVVDSNNVKMGSNWWLKPNGTGPFKLKVWTKGSQLILEKNALYYGKVAQLDSVVYRILAGVPMDMYETGQIDVTGVSVADMDKVTDKAGPFYTELTITPELSFYYLGFNTGKPPFDDANIRRAFTLAIDNDKLASLVFRDTIESARGILPPGIPGFNKDLSGLGYDAAEAKRLIAESRYGSVGGLPPITVTTVGWGNSIGTDLKAIIYQWRQNLGVDVQVRQLEPERYYYHLKDEVDNMFDMGWIADYAHPQDFLDILFRSRSENNYGGYSNPQVDSLLKRAGLEQNTKLSLALYQQVEQKLVDDAAVIPLWFGRNFILVKPYVKGYKLNPMGLVDLSKVSVEAH